MISYDLIIAGGGASGVMAAILAKDFGLDVALIESTDRICKKVLTTGNGRCNISNANICDPFINYHSSNGNFFFNALKNFSVTDTKNFFLSLGLPICELENGKLYPQSLQASSVIDIFRLSLEERNIPVYLNCKISHISKNKDFNILTNNNEYSEFTCKNLILCTGGKSAPKTGSDGSMYSICKSLNHRIIDPIPGIVQLKLDYPHLKSVSGVKFQGAASIYINDELIRIEKGELLFTNYGISGPPILQLSYYASEALQKNKKVSISLDMFPDKSYAEVYDTFSTHFSIFSYREISNCLIGLINKKLIPTLLKDCNIRDIHSPCSNLDWKNIDLFIKKLKNWTFNCIDTNGFGNAQVTVGGVNTKDINPSTLESKLIKNLYFCGELLDVNGDCGGFNLQWAWSSAYTAIEAISAKKR